jgi:hypothetical protein
VIPDDIDYSNKEIVGAEWLLDGIALPRKPGPSHRQ